MWCMVWIKLALSFVSVCIWLKNDLYWIWLWSEIGCGNFEWCWDGSKLVHMLLRNDLSLGFAWKEGEKLKQCGLEILEKQERLRDSIGNDRPIGQLWFFMGIYFMVLSFKRLMNRLNPRFVENVMVIFPKLCRMDQNWHACVPA